MDNNPVNNKLEKVDNKNPRKARKSSSDFVLWKRRTEEYRMWCMGISKSEIARQFNLSFETVSKDMKAYVMTENMDSIRDRIHSGYLEIVRNCYNRLKNEPVRSIAAVGLLQTIKETYSRLAKLNGLEKENTVLNLSQTLNVDQSENPYSKFDNGKLRTEYNRRQQFIESGDCKKGKG